MGNEKQSAVGFNYFIEKSLFQFRCWHSRQIEHWFWLRKTSSDHIHVILTILYVYTYTLPVRCSDKGQSYVMS